jgi:hypothetical protein
MKTLSKNTNLIQKELIKGLKGILITKAKKEFSETVQTSIQK